MYDGVHNALARSNHWIIPSFCSKQTINLNTFRISHFQELKDSINISKDTSIEHMSIYQISRRIRRIDR